MLARLLPREPAQVQPSGIGVRRSNSRRIERVEPPLGGVGGLLELFAGTRHSPATGKLCDELGGRTPLGVPTL